MQVNFKLLHFNKAIISGLFFSILTSLVTILLPLSLKTLIDGSMNLTSILTIVGLFFLQMIFALLAQFLIAVAGEKQVTTLRKQLHQRLLTNPISFFDNEKSGELASHVLHDSDVLRSFLTHYFPEFVTGLITLTGSLIVLFLLDWRLALFMTVLLPLLMILITPLSRISGKFAQKIQNLLGDLTSIVSENFQQIRLIKSTCAEEQVQKRFDQKINLLYRTSQKNAFVEAFTTPLAMMMLFGMVVIIFAYGGVRVAEGSLTVGTLISFLIYLFQLLNPVSNIASFFSGKAKAEGALNYLKELTAVTPENPTGDKASSGELALSHLSFSYDQEIILDDISMTFPQGKKIALVGPSGAGKSTIVHLLERFYPLSTGTLTLNKKDSRLIALKDWREKFALVSQDNQLLAGTIAENLQLGLPVPASDDQLFAALKVAYLEKEVKALPDGLQTIIGENGVKLSGGQKQRLQLARAYLRKPEFLILDEATANLDSDSEQYIQKSLASVMVGKTTIAIAHRLATIIDADIIYFLENHHVTGQGTHQELLSTHPSYARFVKEQFLD